MFKNWFRCNSTENSDSQETQTHVNSQENRDLLSQGTQTAIRFQSLIYGVIIHYLCDHI